MTLSRRDLLALAASMPAFRGLARARIGAAIAGPLPVSPDPGDEAAWERIKGQFAIDGLHLNTGTYGACPYPVIEATVDHLRSFERIIGQDPVNYPAFKADIEAFLGAWPGSIAVLRNTTEAMNVAAAGLDLAPGDEVLSTTHEHIGGRCCWEVLAKRRGIVYRTFVPPLDPANEDELVAAWQAQVTPRTRVLSIAHVLFSTGMIQPVAKLVRWARDRGMISVIDGAHPPGMLALDLQALDADFYATSTHKWLLGPKGTGLLIVRPDRIATTWPLIGSGDWAASGIERFEHVGTTNDALVAGLGAAVTFQRAIGITAIEQRARGLATHLFEALAQLPRVRLVSPRAAALRSAMVSFTMEGTTAAALQGYLGASRIRTRRVAEFGYEYLRLSSHIYVLPRDLDRTVELLRAAPRS
ncbi:MAG TPA: aminotransferase class V-fold PLP-dependent enzyme [Gemmatimonadales bacterium]|nr:aminotransferase class V-fold PLP-dependent enzyme [Gemmatimonadales bacterium]